MGINFIYIINFIILISKSKSTVLRVSKFQEFQPSG